MDIRQAVHDAIGAGEGRADQRFVKLYRYIDAAVGDAVVPGCRAVQALRTLFAGFALDDPVQREGCTVINPEEFLTMHVPVQRRDETSCGCRALLGENAGHFPVTDAGCRVVPTRQAEQRRRCALQLATSIKHHNPGAHLVDDHEGHALVVGGGNHPVGDV